MATGDLPTVPRLLEDEPLSLLPGPREPLLSPQHNGRAFSATTAPQHGLPSFSTVPPDAGPDGTLGAQAQEASSRSTTAPLYSFRQVRHSLLHRAEVERFDREILRFALFFTLYVFILLSQRDQIDLYTVRSGISDLFLDEEFPRELSSILRTFKSVHRFPELWGWLFGPFAQALIPVQVGNTTQRILYEHNYVIGAIRLRQVRVKANSCRIPDFGGTRNSVPTCISGYRIGLGETAPFGPDDKFTYSGPIDTGAVLYSSSVLPLTVYPAGGYVQDILPSTDANATLLELYNDRFLDRQSRALLVTMNVYNLQLDVFTVVTFGFELTASGYIQPFSVWGLFRLDPTIPEARNVLRIVAEVVFLVMIMGYTQREFRNFWRRQRVTKDYWSDTWNVLEVISLLLLLLSAILWIVFLLNGTRRALAHGSTPLNTERYVKLEPLATLFSAYKITSGLALFLSTIKIFKYLQQFGSIAVFWRTLSHASVDLFFFFLIFINVFLAFVLFGHFLFGVDLDDFAAIHSALGTCFLFAFGEGLPGRLVDTNRILGPVFLVLYVMLVYFVLVNVFIAIVLEAYLWLRVQPKRVQTTSINPLRRAVHFLGRWAKWVLSYLLCCWLTPALRAEWRDRNRISNWAYLGAGGGGQQQAAVLVGPKSESSGGSGDDAESYDYFEQPGGDGAAGGNRGAREGGDVEGGRPAAAAATTLPLETGNWTPDGQLGILSLRGSARIVPTLRVRLQHALLCLLRCRYRSFWPLLNGSSPTYQTVAFLRVSDMVNILTEIPECRSQLSALAELRPWSELHNIMLARLDTRIVARIELIFLRELENGLFANETDQTASERAGSEAGAEGEAAHSATGAAALATAAAPEISTTMQALHRSVHFKHVELARRIALDTGTISDHMSQLSGIVARICNSGED